jgi:hypothetical protein
MDLMQSFDAILFPADGRPPHVVSLMTSPASFSNPHAPAQTSTARIPHPEVHMEYIAEDPNIRAWHYQVCAIFLYHPLGHRCSLLAASSWGFLPLNQLIYIERRTTRSLSRRST